MTGADLQTSASVTAIVVTWNTRSMIDDCLTAIFNSARHVGELEVIVVDNASRDGSADLVRQRWPQVRLIENTENVGYTRANNQAIRVSSGQYLLLVNADAFVRGNCVGALCAQLDEDARAAVVGPRLVYGDGTWQRWTAGRAPSLGAAINHYLFLERVGPEVFGGLYLAQDVRTRRRVDWVSSACMLVRRAALDEIGLMDERFFVYMDDVDLCQRARDAAWGVWYRPDAECVHLMGRSTRPEPGSISKDALRNFNRYFVRRHGLVRGLALRAIEALGFGVRVAAYLGASFARGDPALRAKARAHWAYLRLTFERTPA